MACRSHRQPQKMSFPTWQRQPAPRRTGRRRRRRLVVGGSGFGQGKSGFPPFDRVSLSLHSLMKPRFVRAEVGSVKILKWSAMELGRDEAELFASTGASERWSSSLFPNQQNMRFLDLSSSFSDQLYLSPHDLLPSALMKGLLNMCRGETRWSLGGNQSRGCLGLVHTFVLLHGCATWHQGLAPAAVWFP
ncbi:hypothetical protein U1Q18_005309 [Sarracenia purpurea var. burkii]